MQRDRRAPDLGALRYRLLAGAAAIALSSLAATAQAQQAPAATSPAPSGADGLAPDAVYIEADAAGRAGDVITAESAGADRVLARFRGATLRAGAVTYDLGLGVANSVVAVEEANPPAAAVRTMPRRSPKTRTAT